MSGVAPPPPPPPPPAPPPAPPLPHVDPDELRPSKRWYWLAGAIVVVGTLIGSALAIVNAVNEVDAADGFQISLISYVFSLGGGGIGAMIGGITWSRRTDHRRRLQQQALHGEGPA